MHERYRCNERCTFLIVYIKEVTTVSGTNACLTLLQVKITNIIEF